MDPSEPERPSPGMRVPLGRPCAEVPICRTLSFGRRHSDWVIGVAVGTEPDVVSQEPCRRAAEKRVPQLPVAVWLVALTRFNDNPLANTPSAYVLSISAGLGESLDCDDPANATGSPSLV